MSTPESLYKCTSCNEPIPATKARLSCSSCTPRITICANCYVVQDYPPLHADDAHSISLHRHSGFLPIPPPPPPRSQTQPTRSPSSYGPPRRRPISTPVYSDVPPRKPPRPANVESKCEVEGDEGIPATPMRPNRSGQEFPEQQAPKQEYPRQSQSAGWTFLLDEDMKPSASLNRLVEELFRHLDPQRTGFLNPEVYSSYIEACGAPESHNIWKYSYRSSNNNYDIADRELTDHFTAYSVDFALRPRTPSPTQNPSNPLSFLPSTISNLIPRTSVSGNQKPMLSQRGFADLTLCSILLNPSSAWGQLNRAMRAFKIPIWIECGELPRDMLPLAPWQPEVERVRILLEGARMKAEEEVDALHARLKMEQKGRQAALDLLDDRVWVYR
ncbi:hypothetical protein BDV18DRAFT_159072 [Aspergillus unguis]